MRKMMIVTMITLPLTMMCGCAFLQPVANEVGGYSMWNENGLRIFLDDNGTPGNYEDDWVVDWEDNRDVRVFVLD